MFRKLKNKKMILAICIAMLFSFMVTGCTKDNKPSTDENTKKEEQKVESNKKAEEVKNDTDKENNEEEKANKDNEKNKKNSSKIEKEEIMDKSFKITFNTPWKTSQDKKYSATVEGKGEQAQEEGVGKLYLKENNTNKIFLLKIKEVKNQKSPKFLEWIDSENLIVTIGHGYGTVSKGGNLYCINIKDDTIVPIYEAKDDKHEVISVEKAKDSSGNSSLILKLNVYEDDNFTKSHKEKLIISNEKLQEIIK